MIRWLAALLFFWSIVAFGESWRFALIGDTPYSEHERGELPRMLEAIADSHVDLVIHVGDFKSGDTRCDDVIFEDRYRMFDASHVPFVLVPGDNEWTDCERVSNGSYDPLERLNKLRSIFWKDVMSLGRKKLALGAQAGAYREHTRFRLGPVLFVTLNLPGPDNNYGMTSMPRDEFLARNPVVLAWLRENFALARHQGLAAIVLLFQADPGFRHYAQGLAHRGFRDFLDLLREETMRFPGQVVVVHGDTHISRIDRPLRDARGRPLPNFTRVETFGYPIMGWTRGIIDTDSPTLLRFETHPWPPKAQ